MTAETGVVSWLSKFVAEKKISLLYLSTFPSAFIMVRCSVRYRQVLTWLC